VASWAEAMKKQCTIAQLQDKLQERIRSSDWARGYCRDCVAPRPYRIPHDGIANWTAHISATNVPGCESLLLDVVDRLRRECDLVPESLSDTVRRLLAWRSR
jgi:hypothetical protein